MPAIQGNFGLQMPRTASVNEYLAEAPDLAGAYARGVQMKEARLSRENAEAERRFNRAMEERKRLEALQQRYGDSIIVNPESGVVDIQASERALQQRKLKEKAAYEFGYQYALGNQQTVLTPDEQAILETDQGRLGIAEAMTKRAGEQAFMERFEAQEAARQRREEAVWRQRMEGMKELQGQKSQSAETIAAMRLAGSAREPMARYRDDAGNWVSVPVSEYRKTAAGAKEAERLAKLTAEEDKIIEHILAQELELDRRLKRGEDVDIEINNEGLPVVEESWFDHDTDTAKERLEKIRKEAEKAKAEKLSKRGGPPGSGVLLDSGDTLYRFNP